MAIQSYFTEYTTDQIKSVLDQMNDMGFKRAYIYFNNTASTAGTINAVQALELVVKEWIT